MEVMSFERSVMMGEPMAPTPTPTPSTNMRVKYKIEFPPGSMGLELEPVIKSSEREIGCRVKDYYIGHDHEGIDPGYLQSRVSVGDIVSSINGEDIKAMPFAYIVDKLRQLRDYTRIISFKNITASWNLGVGIEAPPSLPPSPAPIQGQKKRSTPFANAHTPSKSSSMKIAPNARDENIENESELEVAKDANKSMTTPSRSQRKGLSVAKPNSAVGNSVYDFSPRVIQSAIKAPSAATSTIRSLQSPSAAKLANTQSPLRSADLRNHQLTPSNIKLLQQQQLPTPQLTPAPTKSSSAQSQRGSTVVRNLEAQIDTDNERVTRIISRISEGLARVGESVGTSTFDAAINVGTVLGSHAEKVVAHTSEVMPRYTEAEMNEIIQKKNHLLNELSTSVMLLGQAEDRYKETMDRLNELEIVSESVQRLTLELAEKNIETEDQRSRILELESALHNYEEQLTKTRMQQLQEQEMISQLNLHLTQGQLQLNEVMQQMYQMESERNQALEEKSEWQNKCNQAENMHRSDQKAWEEQMQAWFEEQNRTRKEMEDTFKAAAERIEIAEKLRDAAIAEVEVTKDLMQTDQTSKDSEVHRLKDAIANMQLQHKQQLLEKESEAYDVRRELQDAKNQLLRMEQQCTDSERENKSLREETASMKADLKMLQNDKENLEHSTNKRDESLKLVLKERDSLVEMAQTKDLQIQELLEENAMLEDRIRISKMTSEALTSELKLVQEDVATHQQVLQSKDLTTSRLEEQLSNVQVTSAFLCDDVQRIKSVFVALDQNAKGDILRMQRDMIMLQDLLQKLQETQAGEHMESLDVESELRDEVLELREKCLMLEQELQSTSEEKVELIERSTADMQMQTQQLQDLRNELQSVREALQSSQQDKSFIMVDHAKHLQEVNLIMNQLTADRDQAMARIQEVEQDLTSALIATKSSLLSNDANYQQQLQALEISQSSLQQQLDESKQSCEHANEQIKQWQSRSEQLQEQLHSKEQLFVQSLNMMEKKHDNMLLDHQQAISALQEEKSVLLEQLQQGLEEHKKELEDLQTSYQKLSETLQYVQIENAQLIQKQITHESNLAALQATSQEYYDAWQQVESTLVEEKTHWAQEMSVFREASNAVLASKEQEIVQLRQGFQAKMQELNQAMEKTLWKEVRQLRQQLQDNKVDVLSLTALHQNIVKLYHDNLLEKEETKSVQLQAFNKLQNKWTSQRQENEDLGEKCALLEKELQRHEHQWKDLEGENSTLLKDNQELARLMVEAQEQQEVNVLQVKVLQEEKTSLQQQLVQLQQACDHMMTAKEQKQQDEYKYWKQQVDLAEGQIQQLEQSLLQAHAEKLHMMRMQDDAVHRSKQEQQDSLDSLRCEYEEALKQVKEEHASALDELTLRQKDDLLQSQLESEETRLALEQAHLQQLESQQKEFEDKRQEFIHQHEIELQSLLKQHSMTLVGLEEEVSRMQELQGKSVEDTIACYEARLRDAEYQYKLREEDLNKQLHQWKQQVSTLEEQVVDLYEAKIQLEELQSSRQEEFANSMLSAEETKKLLLEKQEQLLLFSNAYDEVKQKLEQQQERDVQSKDVIEKLQRQIKLLSEDLEFVQTQQDKSNHDKVLVQQSLHCKEQLIEELTLMRQGVELNYQVLEEQYRGVMDRLETSEQHAHGLQVQRDEVAAAMQSQRADFQEKLQMLRTINRDLQESLELAQAREVEHQQVVERLEDMLRNVQEQCHQLQQRTDHVHVNSLLKKYQEECQHLVQQKQEEIVALEEKLETKQTEVNTLSQHVLALVKETCTTPVKTRLSSSPISLTPDKENLGQILRELPVAVHDSPASISSKSDNEDYDLWHDSMVTLSLQLHETIALLSFVFRNPEPDSHQFCPMLQQMSAVHHEMHESLMRAPWMKYGQSFPSLTPAYEMPNRAISNTNLVAAKDGTKVKSMKIAHRFIIRVLLRLLRQYKQHVRDMNELVQASLADSSLLDATTQQQFVEERVPLMLRSSAEVAIPTKNGVHSQTQKLVHAVSVNSSIDIIDFDDTKFRQFTAEREDNLLQAQEIVNRIDQWIFQHDHKQHHVGPQHSPKAVTVAWQSNSNPSSVHNSFEAENSSLSHCSAVDLIESLDAVRSSIESTGMLSNISHRQHPIRHIGTPPRKQTPSKATEAVFYSPETSSLFISPTRQERSLEESSIYSEFWDLSVDEVDVSLDNSRSERNVGPALPVMASSSSKMFSPIKSPPDYQPR